MLNKQTFVVMGGWWAARYSQLRVLLSVCRSPSRLVAGGRCSAGRRLGAWCLGAWCLGAWCLVLSNSIEYELVQLYVAETPLGEKSQLSNYIPYYGIA
jgi:hypothetical protein